MLDELGAARTEKTVGPPTNEDQCVVLNVSQNRFASKLITSQLGKMHADGFVLASFKMWGLVFVSFVVFKMIRADLLNN